MIRTHTCGALRATDAGQRVTLQGWVHRRRDHGGLVFIDLRDRYGLTQLVFNPAHAEEAHKTAEQLRSEFVVTVEGTVGKRPAGTENPHLPTGEIEVVAEQLAVLNTAKTPPFYINEDAPVEESLRLKYRYLDLRRQRLRDTILLRHRVVKFMRDYLDARGFVEIETPILTKSTPEGARDYLVPSRLQPGGFFGLPQSPQQFKQLLMVAGMDRYFQIARCFRDEDSRGDRQPEFTQLDLEMSYVHRDDVLALVEALYTEMIPAVATHKKILSSPWPTFSYHEVVERYGTDKPDLRFGMELIDVGEIFAKSEFKVFQSALANGGVVKCIVAPKSADMSRKEVDALTESAKALGAKGLATLAVTSEGLKGTAAKFVKDEEVEAVKSKAGAKEGDLILFAADERAIVNKVLGGLRVIFRDRLNLADPNTLAFAWVVDFPMFAWNEQEKKWDAEHHPFTMPQVDDLPKFETNPADILSDAYDMVCNGYEMASGSIRIHRSDIQLKVFQLLGLG